MRIAYGPTLCHAALHVAFEKGFFDEAGIRYEKVPLDSSQTVDGAASGKIDAGMGLIGKFAQPLENGLDIKLTTGVHTGCIKVVTKGDSAINTLADLRGKKIGVASLADSPAYNTMRALAAVGVGVTPDNMEVNFVVFPNSELPIALEKGAIDAYAGTDPSVSVAIARFGLKTLMDTAKTAPFAQEFCCAGFVTGKFAKAHPDLARKYTEALIKAAYWVEAHPQETAQLQIDKKYVSGDAAFNGKILADYNFNASVEGGKNTLDESLADLKKIGILKNKTDVKALSARAYLSFPIDVNAIKESL
jgi:NitT/TauT family transport system substrate-binding protein